MSPTSRSPRLGRFAPRECAVDLTTMVHLSERKPREGETANEGTRKSISRAARSDLGAAVLRVVAMPPRRRSARAGATDAGAPSTPRPVPTAAGEKPARVQVVVLGDFGRSPRMQYHALSLADSRGADVDVVAYTGSEPRREVASHPNIRMSLISPPPRWTESRRVPRVVALAVRVATQTTQMLWTVAVALPRPTHVLLQTPPCVPSFAVCWLVCFIRRAKFVIDWHNLAYTLMALKFGPSSPLVRVATMYERMMGRLGHAHFAVTDAMATWLHERWGIEQGAIAVLHDAPPEFFRPSSPEETRALMRRLAPALTASPARVPGDCCDWGRSLQGQRWREGRTALVVSSPDEDFGVLLDALTLYDEIAVADEDAMERYPDVLVVVTGKGPQRAHYESRMRSLRLNRVAVRTAWLESGDYPTLLGAADLGVCAHTSSSGLDLPMKVVDMFGCGLPVLAARYDVIHELVREDARFKGGSVTVGGARGKKKPVVRLPNRRRRAAKAPNGCLFGSPGELAAQLCGVLEGFGAGTSVAEEMRARMRGELEENGGRNRWRDNWERVALRVFS